MDRWATFDCYGTLIDWELGIKQTRSDLARAAELTDLQGLPDTAEGLGPAEASR